MSAVDDLLFQLAEFLGTTTLTLNPLLAVILLGLTCGAIGSTVVGNRMAFFSDAMAHTAFAGVALAILNIILFANVRSTRDADGYLWIVLPTMILTGIIVGAAMTAVRERTGLTNDTVIGVFFAAAIGLGAMLLPEVKRKVNFDAEQFLYGSITFTQGEDLVTLAILTVITLGIVAWRYNSWATASFNPSLARSRGIAVRVDSYLFVILLALVVNVSIRSVGILLINALLIVPAAAAANVSRNLRQVFWFTLVGTILAGVVGLQICQYVRIPLGGTKTLELAPSGTIVMVAVLGFFATMLANAFRRRS
ncbi:MAG: metal ABC transporter permease [Fimbriiglobus sp.]